MIHIKCPKCEEKMSVDDSKAGGVATCAECGQKFRIPGGKPAAVDKAKTKPVEKTATQKRPAQPKDPAAKPAAPPPPTRPKYDWEEEDSSPYEVSEQQEQTDAAKVVAKDSFRDKEYERIRKKKERELQLEDRKQNIAFLGSMILLWAAMGILAYFLADYFYVPIGIGVLVMLAGQFWLAIIGFKEGALHGVLLLFIWPYDLYFAIKNFGFAGRAFIMTIAGWLMAGTALAVAFSSLGGEKFDTKVKKLFKGDFSARPAEVRFLAQNWMRVDARFWQGRHAS